MSKPGRLLVGVYAWTAAMAFGATLLDVVYAAQAPGESTVVPAEVRDFLLVLVGLTVLTAIGAIAAAWGRVPARTMLAASLAVVLVGLLTPAVLSGTVHDAEGALGVRIGPWLRLGEGGLASVLAFIGLWESWRTA